MDISKANITGTAIALLVLVLCSLIFIFRLSGQTTIEYWLGVVFLLTAIPLVWLLIKANHFNRSLIYYIQISLMLLFILAELLLDYVFIIDFRHIKWMTIIYVTIFFGATGGMIGLASCSGKVWTILASALFMIMTVLALVQRSKTGM